MSDTAVQAALLEEKASADILRGTGISVIEAARSVASWLAKLKPLGTSVSDAIDFYLTSHSGSLFFLPKSHAMRDGPPATA